MPNFWSRLRKDFPITRSTIYLDHASGGVTSRPVFERLQRYSREMLEKGDRMWPRWLGEREAVRQKVARFINADSSEIAFISSASQGMNAVAELLAGEGAVLTDEDEFPSSTLPWLWRKTEIIWQKSESGRIPLAKLKSLLSPKVRTLVMSHVQYKTGFRQDLAAVGRMKGKRAFVVNASQSLGAFPVDVKKWRCDFLVSNGHKWLMASYGTGIFYMNKAWLARTRPLSVGWRSMKQPDRMDNRCMDLVPEASRYELGCPNFVSIFSLGAAVDYLSEIGMDKISERILSLTDYAIEGLKRRGFEIISPQERANRSGIVVFKVKDAESVCRRLLKEGIYVSARGAGIRIAPHFYNTEEEIETFLKKISSCHPRTILGGDPCGIGFPPKGMRE